MAPQDTKSTLRIAIVGVGQVGGAVAYALILGSTKCELLLVDVKLNLRNAQIRDLSDVAYASGGRVRVRGATHHEAGQCDIVVITAGSRYSLGKPGSRRGNGGRDLGLLLLLTFPLALTNIIHRRNQHPAYASQRLGDPERGDGNDAVPTRHNRSCRVQPGRYSHFDRSRT